MATQDNFFCPECQGQAIREDEPGTLYCSDCGYAETLTVAVEAMVPLLGPEVIKHDGFFYVTPAGHKFPFREMAAKHYLLGDS